MATSSSDCGSNGYCIYEWNNPSQQWILFENRASNGFVCDPPAQPNPIPPPNGTLVLTCAEPASS